MISHFQMYWLVMLDNISTATVVFSVLSTIIVVVCTILWIATYGSDGENDIRIRTIVLKLLKIFLPMAIPCMTLAILLPTTKQVAVIVIAPIIINKASESDVLERIPEELMSLAMAWLKELNPENNPNIRIKAKKDIDKEIRRRVLEFLDNNGG